MINIEQPDFGWWIGQCTGVSASGTEAAGSQGEPLLKWSEADTPVH